MVCRVFLVEGSDLNDYLTKHPQLSSKDKVVLFLDVLKAVKYAHSHQIVHRDIKPQNILVSDSCHVTLVDFGVAYLHQKNQQITQVGSVLGTPNYMAPEQANGSNWVDVRSDVFSLGVLLCELLTGERPFVGQSMGALFSQIINEPPQIKPQGLKSSYRLIISTCLHKEPSHRYQSISELEKDLIAASQDQPIAAKKLAWGYRLGLFLQRHPKSSMLTFLLLLGLTVLLVLNRQNEINAQQKLKHTTQAVYLSKEIEAQVQKAHLRPLHDIQTSYQEISTQLDTLLQLTNNEKVSPSSVALTSVGQAYLTLRKNTEALAAFSEAKRLGADDAVWAQGYAISSFYVWKRAKEEANLVIDPSLKKTQLKAVESKHLLPLLTHLKTSEQSNLLNYFVQGMMKYIEGDHDSALTLMKQAQEQNPWFYEAWRMESEILLVQLVKVYQQSGLDASLEHLKASEMAIKKAINMGRSDPFNYHSMCTHLAGKIQMLKLKKATLELKSVTEETLRICQQASMLDPSAYSPSINLNIAFLTKMGFSTDLTDGELMGQFDTEITRLKLSQKAHPLNTLFNTTLAETHYKYAINLSNRELSPIIQFDAAQNVLNELIQKEPKHTKAWSRKAFLSSQLGLYYFELTDDLEDLLQAQKYFRESIEANRMVLTLNDTNISRLNIGIALNYLAEIERQQNSLDLGLELFTQGFKSLAPISLKYAHVDAANPWVILDKALYWLDHSFIETDLKAPLTAAVKTMVLKLCNEDKLIDSSHQISPNKTVKSLIEVLKTSGNDPINDLTCKKYE